MAPAGGAAVRHLVAGLALPDLALASTKGGPVNLGKRAGQCLVYVYPWTGRPGRADPPGWDDIPGAHGSTPETEGFRDAHSRFAERGTEVFGLSTQSCEHQRELSARLGLPFALLSDEAFAFQSALGLPMFPAGDQRFLCRLTLVVGDGRLQHLFYPVEMPAAHAGAVVDWLVRQG